MLDMMEFGKRVQAIRENILEMNQSFPPKVNSSNVGGKIIFSFDLE